MRKIISTFIMLFYAFSVCAMDSQEPTLKQPVSLKFAAAETAATKIFMPNLTILPPELREYYALLRRNQHISHRKVLGVTLETIRKINYEELLLDAIKNNETSIIKDLLDSKKIDPNTIYSLNNNPKLLRLGIFTPLGFAAYCNNIMAIDHLLNHGANPDQYNYPDLKRILPLSFLHTINPHLQNTTPFIIAVLQNNIAAAQELLKHKVNPNQLGKFGISALHESKSAAMTELLILAGANIDQQSKSLDTPLMFAVKTNNLDKINVLLKNGARQDLRNDRNLTALDEAKKLKNAGALYLLTKPSEKSLPIKLNFLMSRRLYDQSTQGIKDIL